MRQVFLRAFARDPLAEEVEKSLEFIEHQSVLRGGNDSEAWVDWCQALLSMNEFSYVE